MGDTAHGEAAGAAGVERRVNVATTEAQVVRAGGTADSTRPIAAAGPCTAEAASTHEAGS